MNHEDFFCINIIKNLSYTKDRDHLIFLISVYWKENFFLIHILILEVKC